MPFKSKAQARAAFAGVIPGLGKKKAKQWAKKTDFSKIPDKVTESEEVTSGVKAPKPEITSGVKSPKTEVTSGLDKSKSTGAAKVETKKPDVGEAKIKPEVTSGVKSTSPEVKTGLDKNKKPEVTSLTKENVEVTSGVKAPKPEVEEGVKSPTPQVTSGLKEAEVTSGVKAPKPEVDEGIKSPTPQVTSGLKEEDDKLKDNGEEKSSTNSTEGFEGKMDENSEAKHKSLEEKVKALKAEMEELEKEMESVKELGVKKFQHNTKKEEVAKLGEEIKALKEKSKDPTKFPTHDRSGNEHMPKPTQNIPSKKWKASKNRKGWKKDIKKELDEKAKVLSEGFSNAYVSKSSRKNLISERVLKTYWEKAIKLQEQSESRDKSKKTFWYGVVKKFEGMLNEQELVKAKSIMTEREKFTLNTEKFINCLASDDYVSAGEFMNAMVESSLNGMIDVAKIQYQKELGEKITKKLREV